MNRTKSVLNRGVQPQVLIPRNIEVPMSETSYSANGVPIYTLNFADRDVVRFSFVFRAGTSWQDKSFVASVAVNTISEGSRGKTSMEVAEQLDYYGSYFDVTTDRDYAVVTFCCLSRFFEQTLDIAREILIYPVFPGEELKTYCDKAKQRLLINRRKVSFVAREEFARALFGFNHPYGHTSEPERYEDVLREDVVKHYETFYCASNCFVVTSGDMNTDHLTRLTRLVELLPQGKERLRENFPDPYPEQYVFKRFPDAVQSSIRIGRLLFPRSHPDYIGMQVAANVLGGYFGSRLMRNLREERGYTYGVHAAIVNFDHAGYLGIGADVGAGATKDAVDQVFFEIDRLRREPVSDKELEQVKKIISGDVMRILDGPFGIADVTIESVQNGTDNHYVERMLDEVREITPGRLHELCDKYMLREDFTTVVVGASM